VSCPRNTFHNFSRFCDTLGVWGSLFSFTTICSEGVERPFDKLTVLPSAMSSLRSELRVEDGPNGAASKDTKFMHVLKQPHRTTSPQRRAFFVPVRKSFRPKDAEAAVRAKESCGSEVE
jgi:hypothetical protein